MSKFAVNVGSDLYGTSPQWWTGLIGKFVLILLLGDSTLTFKTRQEYTLAVLKWL